MLDGETRSFLEQRRRRVEAWRWVGPATMLAMIAVTIWLLIRHPLLVNPLAVARGLADGTLASSTALLMAGLLPMVTGTCLFLVFVVLLFVHAAMRNEKRLLAIAEDLAVQAEGGETG